MKKFIINFYDGEKINMVCLDGINPAGEVEKWQDEKFLVENITSIEEVSEFPDA